MRAQYSCELVSELFFLVLSHHVDNEMGEADGNRSHADPLKSRCEGDVIFRPFLYQQLVNHDKKTSSDRNPYQTGEQQKALDVPATTFNLKFNFRQGDAFLNSGETFLVNDDPAVVLQPLTQSHESDKRDYNDRECHLVLLPLQPFILARIR